VDVGVAFASRCGWVAFNLGFFRRWFAQPGLPPPPPPHARTQINGGGMSWRASRPLTKLDEMDASWKRKDASNAQDELGGIHVYSLGFAAGAMVSYFVTKDAPAVAELSATRRALSLMVHWPVLLLPSSFWPSPWFGALVAVQLMLIVKSMIERGDVMSGPFRAAAAGLVGPGATSTSDLTLAWAALLTSSIAASEVASRCMAASQALSGIVGALLGFEIARRTGR